MSRTRKRQFKQGPHTHECYATVNLDRQTVWIAAPDNIAPNRWHIQPGRLQHMKNLTAADLENLVAVLGQALVVLTGAPARATIEADKGAAQDDNRTVLQP